MQKTAKEAFGAEAQKFIDNAIYAKMPDHVKQILNRAFLEDKPYNDIVLHLEREMRLNGLGAPEETTLVPLNSVDAVTTDDKKTTAKGLLFPLWQIRPLQSTMHKAPKRKILRNQIGQYRRKSGRSTETEMWQQRKNT